jgi:hypothetical protein
MAKLLYLLILCSIGLSQAMDNPRKRAVEEEQPVALQQGFQNPLSEEEDSVDESQKRPKVESSEQAVSDCTAPIEAANQPFIVQSTNDLW